MVESNVSAHLRGLHEEIEAAKADQYKKSSPIPSNSSHDQHHIYLPIIVRCNVSSLTQMCV